MEAYPVIESILADTDNYIDKRFENLTGRQWQCAFFDVVRIFDALFFQYVNECFLPEYDEKSDMRVMAFLYAFPKLISKVYSDPNIFDSVGLSPLEPDSILENNRIVYACFLNGFFRNCADLITLGEYQATKNTSQKLYLKNIGQYWAGEYYEDKYVGFYSERMRDFQVEEYEKHFKMQNAILEQMKPLVYTWEDHYIGYETSPEIDEYFLDAAYLDSREATEWNAFPKDVSFGGISYEVYVKTVVYFVSFAIKHGQFCALLKQKEPKLLMENLLTQICVDENMIKLIQHINGISYEEAKRIFDVLTLNEENCDSHIFCRSAPPPLIKISKHQYLMSVFGCLNRPFEFLLDELHRKYPKEWDKNTYGREDIFRKELYAFFDCNRNELIDRNIVVKRDGKILTDIDACVRDKETGDIGLFQLKWQDFPYSNNKSLVSKRKNFKKTVMQWIYDLQEWIAESDEKTIADVLCTSPKKIDKKKIKLFVLGRFNGSLPAISPVNEDVAFGQWYQVFFLSAHNKDVQWTVEQLYNALCATKMDDKTLIGQPVIYRIGGKEIKIYR